ncbi:MAG: hypothetical protein L0Y58_20100, partial [Verrucomicrobia subdivision 3 bacterium]|nr:hypothetical protein [Limisphaerales bacterium]
GVPPMFRYCAWLLAVVATLGLAATLPAQEKSKTAVKSGGTLKIGDMTFKLTHAVAFESKSSDEKELNILLGVKPIPVDKLKAALEKEGSDSSFFFFEPQVKVKFEEGKASYTFAYADGTSINLSGSKRLTGEATLKDGVVSGQAKLEANPEDEGRFKCSFDIQFSEKLLAAKLPAEKPAEDKPEADEPEPPKTAKAKAKAPKAKKPKSDEDEPVPQTVEEAEALAKKLLAEALGEVDDAPKTKKGKAGDDKAAAPLNVKDLPFPKDASDITYTKLVQQLKFKNPADVKATVESFSGGLEQQGWKKSGSDLVTAKSAILKRTRGKAELTIFVNADGDDGSKVTMMTRGLSWEEK